jgi:hypothetical protein
MEQRDVVAGLRQMKVGLCHPLGAECRLISQQLERLGMSYQQVWPPVMGDLLSVDLVVLALVPEAFIKIDQAFLQTLKNKIVVSGLLNFLSNPVTYEFYDMDPNTIFVNFPKMPFFMNKKKWWC